MKFIDMFCGIGTIRMGMEQAGHECVYSIEWDKWKRRIYGIIFGNEPEGQDIGTVRGVDLPKADVWCFGAPCQDFSIAGTRAGLDGDRSSLVREVFRLVREVEEEYRPSYLFYENVKGMLSSNKGFDFLEILAEMESLGYDSIEYSLLNSKDFGVPQNRERVFTIGHLRGRSTRKVFPIGESSQSTGIEAVGQVSNEGSQAGKVYDPEGIFPTICAGTHGYANGNIIVRPCLTPNRAEKRQNGRRFKEDGEPMFTLTTQDIHGVWIKEATKQGYAEATEGDSINLAMPNSKTRRGRVGKGVANTLDTSCNQGTLEGGRIRRLTPKECWRLQGIPDYITEKVQAAEISDTQMYKGAGDATTVNVIYEIAKRF